VYGLLDDAWERYSAFCEAYEAAGKDLSAFITQLMDTMIQTHNLKYAALLQEQQRTERAFAELAFMVKAAAYQRGYRENEPVSRLIDYILQNAGRYGYDCPGHSDVLRMKMRAVLVAAKSR
jgi:hypothetical protein